MYIDMCGTIAVVELSFRKGRVQSVSMRALCKRIYAATAFEAFFSGSKGLFIIGSFGLVRPFAFIYRHYRYLFMLTVYFYILINFE